MALQDRDAKRDWSNVLMVLAIAIPLAIGAFKLYQKVSKGMAPDEGGLVVNINTATEPELEKIPGVGPSLAHEIIRGRPYAKIEDLERVRGIGHYTLNNMRPYVKVEGETTKR
jgi:competence ComEA-like helix-hairpin-helix protein